MPLELDLLRETRLEQTEEAALLDAVCPPTLEEGAPATVGKVSDIALLSSLPFRESLSPNEKCTFISALELPPPPLESAKDEAVSREPTLLCALAEAETLAAALAPPEEGEEQVEGADTSKGEGIL